MRITRKFLFFSLLTFWPAILFFIFWGWGMLLTFTIITMGHSGMEGMTLLEQAQCVVFLSLPPLMMAACYQRCAGSLSWVKRMVVIYIYWLMLAFEMTYLLGEAFAGISWRDGAPSLERQIMIMLEETCHLMLVFQVFIIPWVAICAFMIKSKPHVFFDSP